ncbi:hypothetical protein [uncultured Aquimarina sp.]|uniref:hypothetical protein n=1 Tax=uncultured Aquimarina sp. TaxID=575652 RepID=UPI002637DA21|nr:hypothetical protein [uncultured Aquimarina sp.]
MKNLENQGLIDMTTNELITIDGGNWWDDLTDAVNDAVEAVEDLIEGLYDNLPTDSRMV